MGSHTFTVDGGSAIGIATISSSLAGSGGILKTGANTLVLSGANTFTGESSVAAGELRLAHSSALGQSTFAGGAGQLSFGDLTAATFGGLSGSTALVLENASSAAVGLTVGANNGNTTYAGVLSGNGSLEKIGSGTLTLSAANEYGGGTVISAGTLVAEHWSALGWGWVTIASGAKLLTPAGVSVNNFRTLAGGALGFTSDRAGGTVASLAAGSAVAPAWLAPSIAWLERELEATFSDVVSLTNTHGQVKLLQMTYDPMLLGEIAEADLFLGWKSGGTWVNAIDGNIGNNWLVGSEGSVGGSALVNQTGSFTSLGVAPTSEYLGSWGRDTESNTVWAVVNHNSQFSVIAVPEPGGMAILGGAVAAAVMAAWRRRIGGATAAAGSAHARHS